MRRTIGIGGLAAAMILASGVLVASLAQTRTPAEQVDYRQSRMEVFGRNARTISHFLRENEGTMADVVAAARAMNEVAQDIPSLFPPGTAVGVGDSKALPAIWENWTAFTESAADARTAIVALLGAAETGDVDAVRARFGAAGRACGGCHQIYRQD